MSRIVISLITIISSVVGLFPAPTSTVDNLGTVPGVVTPIAETRSLTSFEPSVSFVGGSREARRTVLDAVNRFVTTGLALPAIEFRIHDDFADCDGNHGLFHRDDDHAVIDLCADRQLLALHEISHAWERFTLNDNDRDAFVELVGAEAWRDNDIAHHRRGTEIAADNISYALLTFRGLNLRTRPLELFEAITGIESPRITEKAEDDAAAAAEESTEETERELYDAQAAYADWQATHAD